jgi:protein SCO1
VSSPGQIPPGPASRDVATRRADRMITVLGVGLTLLGLLGGLAVAHWQTGPVSREPRRHLTDFTLTDCTGRVVTRADLTNQWLIVNCVFTSCSLSCRVVNDRMAEIQDLVAGEPSVRLVSLTVDPRTDTPAVLAGYARLYRGDNTNRWLFAAAAPDALAELAPRLDLQVAREGGSFAHNLRTVVLDPQGRIHRQFDGNEWTPAQLADALAEAAAIQTLGGGCVKWA